MSPSMPHIAFNRHGVWAIYKFEIARSLRTLVQSLVTPVITTSLYFVVFGAAIGSRLSTAGGVSYGAFIVPGLIMLALFTESLSNASFGIYFPKFTGTIYELLSAPVSYVEIVIGYVGAASTKSVVLGLTILATASLFVPIQILHPVWMVAFLLMTAFTFSLFGFIIGIWAKGFRTAAVYSHADHHPAHLPRGRVLFHRHVAAGLANFQPLQPGRVLDQRLPLELLRHRRRERRCQHEHDRGVLYRLCRHSRLGIQNGISAQELSEPGAVERVPSYGPGLGP